MRVRRSKEKEIYKAAHKAATILYALERSKEGGGMSVRQVEAIARDELKIVRVERGN